jgi:enoyl-CoA hydratase/carnithine racemase
LREESGGVLTLTWNRPEKLNAISDEILDGMRQGVADLASRPDLRVMLICARGRYFSAGMDVSRMSGAGSPGAAATGVDFRRGYRDLHALFDSLEAVEKPVVVAAQGPCLGGALEMSLSCDFRLAAESARYGFPEYRLGVLPGSGGASRLTRLVGPGWARWLVMTPREVDAQTALRMGLVHEVYPDSELDARVQAFVAELAAMPSEYMGLAKLTIEMCADLGRGPARDAERIANTMLVRSEEHRAAVAAFASRKREEG